MSAAARATAALLLCVTLASATAAPAAGYATAEEAFEATFIASGIGRRGYDENREYAAALYQMPDGRWFATPVAEGGRVASSIPYHLVPSDAIRIAGAHTHGQPTLPEDPSRVYGTDFSETDRRNAELAFQASGGLIDSQLLLSSKLEVLQMTVGVEYLKASARIGPATRVRKLFNATDRLFSQAD